MRILVVDDSPDIRMLMTRRLNVAGYTEVLTAESARAAYQILSMDDPPPEGPVVDLILMDINMPEIDGVAACQLIKATPQLQDVPVIMVTAHDEPPYLQAAFDAGASAYLGKSIDKVKLQEKILAVMASNQECESSHVA